MFFGHNVVFGFRVDLFFKGFRIADDISEFMAVELFDFLYVLVTLLEQKLVLRVKGFFIGFREL